MDAATATATAGAGKLGFPKLALASTMLDAFNTLAAVSAMSTTDAAAPPAVRSRRAPPRVVSLRARRTRRRRALSDDRSDEETDLGGFFGNGDDGPFGGGGGGRGWGFDRDGSYSASGGAVGFFYEVLCWIALSNCVHFAWKKVARDCGAMYGEWARSKVPVPALISVY